MEENVRQGLYGFLLQRRKASGGYSATPRLPATIQDTYHALRILEKLGFPEEFAVHRDENLTSYLANAGKAERHDAKVTYQLLSSCLLAGVPVDAKRTADFVRQRLRKTKDLEERFFCRRIMNEVAGRPDDDIQWIEQEAPEKWIFRTASELRILLYLAGSGIERAGAFMTWLQDCQSYDGGFGFLPGTTSFIENCRDCLDALRMLGGAPRDAEACRAFVMACRNRSGGFARRNRAVAFLSSTWHGVASLSLLGENW